MEMTRMTIDVVDMLVDTDRKSAEAKLKISFFITDDEGHYKLKGTVESGWMNVGSSMVIPFDGVEYEEERLRDFGIFPRDVTYVED